MNSGKFGTKHPYETNNRTVERTLIEPWEVKERYSNHEVAVHTLGHFNLTGLSDASITWHVEEDRLNLERLSGKEVRCMAYPCAGVNNDERVVNVIKKNSKICFARTGISTYSFDLQEDLLRYNPTIHFGNEKLFDCAEKFLSLHTDIPKVFYIWGHTYELDAIDNAWERFEEFCRMISGRDDIFYATNGEAFL